MWMKESEICLQVSRSTGPKKVLNLLDSDGKMKIWKWRCQDIGDDESGLQKINWNIAYMTLMSMMKRKVVFQTTTQGVTEPNPNTQTWGIMTARLNLWFYTVCISKGEEILHSVYFKIWRAVAIVIVVREASVLSQSQWVSHKLGTHRAIILRDICILSHSTIWLSVYLRLGGR